MTGVAAAVLDLALTWLLQVGLGVFDDFWARSAGWLAGTVLAYKMNRRWTFGAKSSKRRFSATMLTYVITYVANVWIYRRIFALLIDDMGKNLALLLAFMVAQAVATVVNFGVQRLVIFRRAGGRF
ncbi:GtrA family protein [Corynebacterium tapiri]|uniref:GtrA family protein n=1 Tax=Corynebacterium tapiri TaxID=1448266 RepID=UPI002482FF90|nr:GtrA family protein [Corynebacterium tapiri]